MRHCSIPNHENKRTLPTPPFQVKSIHDGHKLTVIDIDEDPLDVGVVCAYFKEGGWLMISDLFKNFTIAEADIDFNVGVYIDQD